jgi:hypothetical protein
VCRCPLDVLQRGQESLPACWNAPESKPSEAQTASSWPPSQARPPCKQQAHRLHVLHCIWLSDEAFAKAGLKLPDPHPPVSRLECNLARKLLLAPSFPTASPGFDLGCQQCVPIARAPEQPRSSLHADPMVRAAAAAPEGPFSSIRWRLSSDLSLAASWRSHGTLLRILVSCSRDSDPWPASSLPGAIQPAAWHVCR